MAQQINLVAGQISDLVEVGPGTRITVTGSAYVEYAPGVLADAKNGVLTWCKWPKGTSNGVCDTIRRMTIRATATGAATVLIDEGFRDSGDTDSGYWQEQTAQLATDASGLPKLSSGAPSGVVGPDVIRDLSGYNPVGQWQSVYLPSPYDAANFSDLSPTVQAQLDVRGNADWLAMSATQRKGLTHPSLVYVPHGFNGYQWWCAYTPYPAADSDFEQPCIAASRDGVKWEIPIGMPFPLYPAPAVGTSYNSDTHLYYDSLGNRLVLIFRERVSAGNDVTWLTTLSAGASTWAERVNVHVGDMASPSIWYDRDAGKWVIVGHALDQAAPWPMRKIESADLLTGWSAEAAFTVPHPVAGRAWWHSFIMPQADGSYIGIASDNTGTVGQAGDLYLWYAPDSTLNFSARKIQGTRYVPDLGTSSNYRSTFVVVGNRLRLLVSALQGPLAWGYAEPTESKARRAALDAAAEFTLVATAPANAADIIDDFNRTDSATGVGNDLRGNAWTQGSGTNFIGISGNAAYNINANACRIWRDIGSSSHDISAQFRTLGTQAYLMAGLVDTSNHYRLYADSTGLLRLQRVVSGAATDLVVASAGLVSNGAILRLRKVGRLLSAYLDGDLVYTATDATYETATKCGLGASGATTSYVDWVVARKA